MPRRFIAALLVAASLAAALFIAPTAHAGSKGRRNTAAALGAVSAYLLIQGETTPGLIGAAGTVYAYSRYRKAKKQEDRRRRYRRHYRGYHKHSRYCRH